MFTLIMTLASMAMSAYGQISQGRAAKKVAQSQAAAAEGTAKQQEFNAGVADAQAVDAVDRGEEDAARLREQVRGLVGAQRSGFAGQGVVVDTGSAADVQADTKTLGEADVRTIRHNAQRQAWGFRVEAEEHLQAISSGLLEVERAKPAPQEGDGEGKSSRFEITSEDLVKAFHDDPKTVGKFRVIIGGKEFTGEIKHDHDHDAPEKAEK